MAVAGAGYYSGVDRVIDCFDTTEIFRNESR